MATLAWFMIDLGFAPDAFAQPSNQLRYVREPKTPVRCGPGEDFYVASYLKQGAAVEVYHRTKEGWCGIRPPEGSACWLAAENAYLLPGGTSAEIVGKKTPAWIAAAEGNPKQLRWQIELQPSQQVKVLGEAKQVIDSETERLWYRIAPPQGEFRWVHQDQLSDEPLIANPAFPPLIESNEATRNTSTVQPASANAKQPPKGTSPNQRDAEVATAQYQEGAKIVKQHVEPYQIAPGEELVGGDTIVSDRVISGGDGDPNASIEYEDATDSMEHHGMIEEGEVYAEGEYYEETSSPHGGHRSTTEHVFVRPLNGILGWLGFGIAEAEVAEPEPGFFDRHRTTNSLMDRSTATRLDQLPRPTRRSRNHQSLLMQSGSLGRASGDGLANREYSNRGFAGAGAIGTGAIGSSTNLDNGLAGLRPLGSDRLSSNSLDRSLLVGPNDVDARQSLGVNSSQADWHAATGRAAAMSNTNAIGSPPSMPLNDSTSARRIDANAASYQASSNNSLPSGSLQLSTPQLKETFFELTRIVSQPTEQWDLRAVQEIASQWVARGPSATERGEARLLLARIEEFEAHRQKMLYGGGQDYNRLANHYQPMGSPESELPLASAREADASGWLSPVHTSRPGQPEFALTDANGNVVAYVSAVPGMNLRRYSKQAVAIYGTKGYLPELASRQIVADRIVRLR